MELLPTNEKFATLNELRDFCYQESKDKVWHESNEVDISKYVSNLHGEVSELWEASRNSSLDKPCDKASKMIWSDMEPLTCAAEELADVIIRTLDTCKALNVDIGRAVVGKLRYNRTRPHRHGGKLA
jgi:NTP pyrophosphatase (non-canonical NTP hydrolase)